MSKTLIVAQREFVENLRTKTFWIGILSLPLILAASIAIGRFLEKSKDVRTYAVVDLSENDWLSRAIETRAAQTDLGSMLRGSGEDGAAGPDIETWLEGLPEDHPIRDLLGRIQEAAPDFDPAALGGGEDRPRLPPAVQGTVLRWALEVQRDPARAKVLQNLASSIALARYRRLELDALGVAADQPIDAIRTALNRAVADEELFAYFILPADPLADDAGEYVSNNLTDGDLRSWFERHATSVVRARRIEGMPGVTQADADLLLASFPFREQRVSSTGETETVDTKEKAAGFAPVAFVYLLWIAVFTAAQMLLTNTVEEKSNRLIEVLLSSVSPLQLMAGKVIGIAATGLTIVGAWVGTALIGSQLVPDSGKLGQLDLAGIIGDPLYLTSFVGYFLAGYLLYAAILVALGSVCNSLKEAQNLMQPVFILLIVPLFAMIFVVQDPNGTVARILTYVPLYTPFLMMNRAGGPPPAWEYFASSALILVSLVIAFWAAAKVFRVGILMTGKPPRVREILRWIRAPVTSEGSAKDAGQTIGE
jgi:ABC-2 type transport system permease protein